jgi:hypothetical protein
VFKRRTAILREHLVIVFEFFCHCVCALCMKSK